MEWISVKDRLPTVKYTYDFSDCIVAYKRYGRWYVECACWLFDHWSSTPFPENITHWMPLPNPPEED